MFCLRAPTDEAWARAAAADLDGVLVDHAHCEMKAATNALSLVVRHPDDLALVKALTALAQEELDHFARCVAFLEKRGLALGAPPVDTYAAELRRAIGLISRHDVHPLVDRLLGSALIEARSCERFKLLLDHMPAGELRDFYEELFACEARHYRTYVDLAKQAAASLLAAGALGASDVDVDARLEQIAEAEARIVIALSRGEESARATVHG